jgi:hypothetical protein
LSELLEVYEVVCYTKIVVEEAFLHYFALFLSEFPEFNFCCKNQRKEAILTEKAL